MSRTYRKTKSKHGAPKSSQSGFSKHQLALIDTPPSRRPPNKYVFVAEVVKVYGDQGPPKSRKDPRWCSKGQPGAMPEYITEYKTVLCYVNGLPRLMEMPQRKETGRFFLPEPDKDIVKTRRKLVREPIDWTDESWRLQWKHQEVFDHVRRNRCWRRDGSFEKYMKRRELRNQGREIVRKWEDEYHLNEHLLPYSWVLDGDDYDFDDIFGDYGDDFDDYYNSGWNDDYDANCDYCSYPSAKCRCDDDSYYDYDEYDPWNDLHIPDDRRIEIRDQQSNHELHDSGKSLGEILGDVLKKQQQED